MRQQMQSMTNNLFVVTVCVHHPDDAFLGVIASLVVHAALIGLKLVTKCQYLVENFELLDSYLDENLQFE